MTLLETLLDAINRLEGDALVMHVGERPYVLTTSNSSGSFRGPLSWGQVELSTRALTAEAVMSMAGQMLPPAQLQILDEIGAVEHEIDAPGGLNQRFVVVAARGGDDVWVEVRRKVEPAPEAAAEPEPMTQPEAPVYAVSERESVPAEPESGSVAEARNIEQSEPEVVGTPAADVEIVAADANAATAEPIRPPVVEDDNAGIDLALDLETAGELPEDWFSLDLSGQPEEAVRTLQQGPSNSEAAPLESASPGAAAADAAEREAAVATEREAAVAAKEAWAADLEARLAAREAELVATAEAALAQRSAALTAEAEAALAEREARWTAEAEARIAEREAALTSAAERTLAQKAAEMEASAQAKLTEKTAALAAEAEAALAAREAAIAAAAEAAAARLALQAKEALAADAADSVAAREAQVAEANRTLAAREAQAAETNAALAAREMALAAREEALAAEAAAALAARDAALTAHTTAALAAREQALAADAAEALTAREQAIAAEAAAALAAREDALAAEAAAALAAREEALAAEAAAALTAREEALAAQAAAALAAREEILAAEAAAALAAREQTLAAEAAAALAAREQALAAEAAAALAAREQTLAAEAAAALAAREATLAAEAAAALAAREETLAAESEAVLAAREEELAARAAAALAAREEALAAEAADALARRERAFAADAAAALAEREEALAASAAAALAAREQALAADAAAALAAREQALAAAAAALAAREEALAGDAAAALAAREEAMAAGAAAALAAREEALAAEAESILAEREMALAAEAAAALAAREVLVGEAADALAALAAEAAESHVPAEEEPAASRAVMWIRPKDQPPIHGSTEGLVPVLQDALERGASTVYAVAGARAMLRIEGEIASVPNAPVLAPADIDRFAFEFAPRDEVAAAPTEWMSSVPGVGRVRCVSFEDESGRGLVFHLAANITSADELGLSREVQALSREADGLVVIAGPRGSGKSSLLGAFVDLINRTRADHVITIESRVRTLHERRHALISQREVDGDGDAVARAVRAALREGPDVLVVDDVRSPEAIAVALDAARAGRLVFASIPASDTTVAIQRLIDAFAVDRRPQIRALLAGALRGVISQILVPSKAGGRVGAREVLLSSQAVEKLILDGATAQVPIAIESGRRLGMRTQTDALVALVRDGVVAAAEASRHAPHRGAFMAALQHEGIDVSDLEKRA